MASPKRVAIKQAKATEANSELLVEVLKTLKRLENKVNKLTKQLEVSE